jgi:hypothetical protein
MLQSRLAKQLSFLGPIPPEAATEKPQSALDGYKQAVREEIDFLRAVLEEKHL